ncbi:MAG TPA: secretin N-terminal domain-containing protein [Planctomycetota bacterium]|nr:secretin N-terminal domain-containing protein [Planctomycetota bacterium]
MTCADMDTLLASRVLAELDRAGCAELDSHLAGCGACRDRLSRLEAWRDARPEPPASRWDELAVRIEADRLRPIRVALTCSYCHDAFGRGDATYCAGCLAPHHEDCFAEHGACSTPGCGETRLVRAGRSVRPGRARRVAFFLAATVLGSGVTVAALRPWKAEAAHVVKAPEVLLHVLESTPGYVSIDAKDANVRDTFEEIARATGKNIIISPEVRGDITLTIRDVPWRNALETIATTVGDYEVVEDAPDVVPAVVRITPRSSVALSPVTRVFQLRRAKAQDLDSMVKTAVESSALGPSGAKGSWYSRDDRSNSFVVSAPATVIKRLEIAFEKLDVAAVAPIDMPGGPKPIPMK